MALMCLTLLAALLSTEPPMSPGDRYIAEMTAAMQANATEASAERVLALFTPDAAYEHPAFDMRVAGTAAMRTARLRQLGATRTARATITGRTALADVEAITLDLAFEARDGDTWRPVTRKQLLLFEYEAGRITRVLEYWQR